eukprot:jgi/Mesen1/1886/ME000143S00941
MRVTGTSALLVTFDGLVFDGLDLQRRVAGIYIVGIGKAIAKKGPNVAFKNVVARRFVLTGLTTRIDTSSRGAAINANIGSTVGIIQSFITDNYAGAGGALQSTGLSEMFVCNVTFNNNQAVSVSPCFIGPCIGMLFLLSSLCVKVFASSSPWLLTFSLTLEDVVELL